MLSRFASEAVRHPLAAVDRVKHKLTKRLSDEPFSYEPSRDWKETLTQTLGKWDEAEFERAWLGIASRCRKLGIGHDADRHLGLVVWNVVRALKPQVVVETGVARGVTSALILQSLDPPAKLYSVDLPPLSKPWIDEVGIAVDPKFHHNWIYRREASKRALPKLEVQPELFVHDSLHNYVTMEFEFTWARHARVVVADDIESNAVFANSFSQTHTVVISHEEKDGLVGVAFLAAPAHT